MSSPFAEAELEQRASAVQQLYRSALLPPAIWSQQVMGVVVTNYKGWDMRGLQSSRPISWPVFKMALANSVIQELPEPPGDIPAAAPTTPGQSPAPAPVMPQVVSAPDTRIDELQAAVQALTQQLDTLEATRALQSDLEQVQVELLVAIEAAQNSADNASDAAAAIQVPVFRHAAGVPTSAVKVWTGVCTTATDGLGAVSIPAGYFTSVNIAHATARRATNVIKLAALASVRSLSTALVQVIAVESKTSGILLGGSAEGLEIAANVVVDIIVVGT